MKPSTIKLQIVIALALTPLALHSAQTNAPAQRPGTNSVPTAVQGSGGSKLDTNRINLVTGLKGVMSPREGVYKVSWPRDEFPVDVDGWVMPPFMGLTSWVAFKEGKTKPVMAMGDLCLFEDEVNPVMSAVLDHGLEVTALHNHFFFDDPKVCFMHVSGQGELDTLAKGVRAAQARIKEIRTTTPRAVRSFGGQQMPAKSSITAQPLEQILGLQGTAKDGMLKVVVGRAVRMHGEEVGADMGVNTWAAFAGTDNNALVDGDFVVLEDELQPVLHSLRKSNINIVAIHHHMTHESPRTIFLHYWGRGPAQDLANGVKAALQAAKSGMHSMPAR